MTGPLRPQTGAAVWRVIWRDTAAGIADQDRQRDAVFTYARDAHEYADWLRFRTRTGQPSITLIQVVELVVDDMLGKVDQEHGAVA